MSLVFALAGACGGGEDGPADPCSFCGPHQACAQVCETPESCSGVCVDLCGDPEDTCPDGHGCVDLDGEMTCDPLCDDALCSATEGCGTPLGECIPVECSRRLACNGAGDLCDEFNHECVPFNGECDNDLQCPLFDGRVTELTDVRCVNGYCNCLPPPAPQLLDLPIEGARQVAITTPVPGASFDDEEDIEIAWSGPDDAAVVIVTEGLPLNRSDAEARTVWGHAHARGVEPQRARWSEGVAVRDGRWGGPPGALDPELVYHAFVTTLHNGAPSGYSRLIAFRVGSAWPELGDACGDEGGVRGECDSPADIMGCLDGACARVCLSHAECDDLDLSCGEPIDGVRHCE